jgi:hypothetical protein
MALFISCEINQTYILLPNESMALSAVILSLKRGFVPLFYVSLLQYDNLHVSPPKP